MVSRLIALAVRIMAGLLAGTFAWLATTEGSWLGLGHLLWAGMIVYYGHGIARIWETLDEEGGHR